MDPTLKPILILMALLLSTISGPDAAGELKPAGGTEYRVAPGGLAAKREPFRTCMTCKCCRGTGKCASMPCCFAVKCNIPGKPHDVCTFVPVYCNCSSCTA